MCCNIKGYTDACKTKKHHQALELETGMLIAVDLKLILQSKITYKRLTYDNNRNHNLDSMETLIDSINSTINL